MTSTPPITPVILSGGAGTRLWPQSTRERPKQFLALASERTMLQDTALRVAEPATFATPIVIGSAGHSSLLKAQLADVDIVEPTLVLEPCARNTAPAIALAALTVAPEQILLVMPSDQVVGDVAAFHAAVATARPFADEGWLVTFGIRPTHPETGFGYIRRGPALAPGIHRVERFVEKPDRPTAETYLADGGYDWNGGIFMFRAGAYLDALAVHAPAVLAASQAAVAQAGSAGADIHPDRDAFAAAPSISIDYAVMETAERVAVVPVEMGWSDIGSWDAIYERGDADARGNVVTGAARAIDSDGCLIQSGDRKVVTIGVQDLIVIAGDDAVLILPRGQSQRVKEALDPQ